MGTEQDLENIEDFLREADTQSELLKRGLGEAQPVVDQEATERLLAQVTDEVTLEAEHRQQDEAETAKLRARLDALRGAGLKKKKKKKKTKTKKRKRMRA